MKPRTLPQTGGEKGLRSAAFHTLNRYRDDQLAHLYFRERERVPNRYEEIFFLLEVARDLIEQASLALRGINIDLQEREQLWLEEAKYFWKPALEAATRDSG